ncbi:MAG: DUF2917 domain-containing protein [Syntrophobacteraceae bacterium]
MQGFRCCQQQEISGCRGGLVANFIQLCKPSHERADRGPRTCEFSELGLPHAECVQLGTGTLHVMDVANHCRLTCTKGVVWVTGSHRGCDYILKTGESLLLQGRSKIIVSGGRKDNVVWICRD